MKVFKLNLPLYLVLILVCGAFAGGKYILSGKKAEEASTLQSINSCPSSMDQVRLKDYELTHPLILTDVNTESNAFKDIQNSITEYVNQAKSNQKADDISVYFRKLDNGSWFAINPNATYNPASMIKIAYLITYMKMAEINPAVLNSKIFFAQHFSQGNNQNIKDFQLKEGVNYTIRDLLTAMIKYSDNDATLLLSQNMNTNIYDAIFKDLDIPIPNPVAEYFISVNDYCKFYRILYSSTYTRPEYSEYALKLLTLSTFERGIKRGIDPNVVVAHKFGERIIGNKAQLHEFGIVFYNHEPYLIGVMTMGNSLEQLSTIVGDISKIAYDGYKLQVNS
jgi:beta-lactamase class A